MLKFTQCAQCTNIVYCPHTENYNKEIEIILNAQATFQTVDVMVVCQYFEQEDKLPRTFKNEANSIVEDLRKEIMDLKKKERDKFD